MTARSSKSHQSPLHPIKGESHAGYFIRLAEALGWESTSTAAGALGLSMSELRWGPRQRRGNSIRLSGHRLPLWAVDQHERRICPQCVQEAPYVREWWEIHLLATCPIHQVPLTSSCSCGADLTWSDAKILGCCPQREVDGAPAAQRDDFEDWLATHLGIVQSGYTFRWLERINLSLALRLLENIALLEASGFAKHAPDSSPATEDRKSTLRRGFEIIHGQQFEAVIAEVVQGCRDSGGSHGTKRPFEALGWFGDWFVDEDLPKDHPMVGRLTAAVVAASGDEPGDTTIDSVTSVTALAVELGLSEDEVCQRMAATVGMQGMLVPTALAMKFREDQKLGVDAAALLSRYVSD